METVLRLLMGLLFPRSFLDRHGPLLLAACRAESRRSRNRGLLGRILLAHEVVGDLVLAAMRLRLRLLAEMIACAPAPQAVPAGSTPLHLVSSAREVHMHPANDRLKSGAGSRFWLSLTVSTLLHAALFYGFPTMSAAVETSDDGRLTVVAPPETPLPPAPEPIARPATPQAVQDVTAPVIIPTQDDLWERIGESPPPPPPVERAAPRPDPWTGPVQALPRLINRDEVARALESHYPALLRDAGIGGRVLVSFFVISDGSIYERRLVESSGHPALDDAAMGVADVMRFAPALNRDRPVPVWVSFPIEFTTRR